MPTTLARQHQTTRRHQIPTTTQSQTRSQPHLPTPRMPTPSSPRRPHPQPRRRRRPLPMVQPPIPLRTTPQAKDTRRINTRQDTTPRPKHQVTQHNSTQWGGSQRSRTPKLSRPPPPTPPCVHNRFTFFRNALHHMVIGRACRNTNCYVYQRVSRSPKCVGALSSSRG